MSIKEELEMFEVFIKSAGVKRHFTEFETEEEAEL